MWQAVTEWEGDDKESKETKASLTFANPAIAQGHATSCWLGLMAKQLKHVWLSKAKRSVLEKATSHQASRQVARCIVLWSSNRGNTLGGQADADQDEELDEPEAADTHWAPGLQRALPCDGAPALRVGISACWFLCGLEAHALFHPDKRHGMPLPLAVSVGPLDRWIGATEPLDSRLELAAKAAIADKD